MANSDERRERLQNLVGEMEKRVEILRKQAFTLKEEKESILELLQDVQDGPSSNLLSEGELEDFDYNIERLILRCLTVEVAVATPRNENQENAFLKVSAIIDDLQRKLKVNPLSHQSVVESHLNACLPEPLSSNVNHRFQEKLLDCTAEDQKCFRIQLQQMLHSAQGTIAKIGGIREETRTVGANGIAEEEENVSDEVLDGEVDGEVDGDHSIASDSMKYVAGGSGYQPGQTAHGQTS